MIRKLLRIVRVWAGPRWGPALQRRIDMTCRCADSYPVPKVPDAGAVFVRRGRRVQRMHQGVLVPADGYHGPGMTEIIRRLRGHHEPQEELLFHHLLSHCRPGTRMLEIGAFWAYYTAWFLSVVPHSRAVCLEPDDNNASCGKETLALNGLTATWVAGAAGRWHLPQTPFTRESDGQTVQLPMHSLESLLAVAGEGPVEVLHIDAQGAELPLLESLADPGVRGHVRFIVASTHHAQISGSPTTHQDCLRAIQALGGTILEEHSVEESYSGDGLIVASLRPADAAIALPAISRNEARLSLFSWPQPPGGKMQLVNSQMGPMLIRQADNAIGRSLRKRGRWEENDMVEVVRFLRRTRGFVPNTFVAAGANIGTFLLRALQGSMFASGIGIEMDADNFRLLEANMAINLSARRPLLLNVALGDTTGEARMEFSPENLGDHRIVAVDGAGPGRMNEEQRRQSTVAMTTLDAIARDHALELDHTSLIWIDTQGYEGQVLAGASAILSLPPDRRPAVVCEFWPYGIERAGGRDRLLAFLAGCGQIHDLRDPDWTSSPSLSLPEVEALYERLLQDRSPTPPHTDLLCLPSPP